MGGGQPSPGLLPTGNCRCQVTTQGHGYRGPTAWSSRQVTYHSQIPLALWSFLSKFLTLILVQVNGPWPGQLQKLQLFFLLFSHPTSKLIFVFDTVGRVNLLKQDLDLVVLCLDPCDEFFQNSQKSCPGLQNSAFGFPSLLPHVLLFVPFPPTSILTLLFPKHTGHVLDLAQPQL